MSAPGKLVRSSRWKTGPSKGQRPLGSECCVTPGDSGHEAYTAIAWGVGLSLSRAICSGTECSGASGAKGGDQGECGPAKHVPDAELCGAAAGWPLEVDETCSGLGRPIR